MRRRIPYRVCRCTPDGCMTHLEARLLRQLVNREIHPLRCAESCRRKRQKAMRLGDLCAETGHFLWAMRVWSLGISLICDKDYDDWRYVWFNTRVVSLGDVTSEEDAKILGRRVDNLWRALGHPEMKGAEAWAEAEYDWLWLEKYDYDRNEWDDHDMLAEARKRLAAEAVFREGQSQWQPPCSQDFFHYWTDYEPPVEESEEPNC